MPGLVGSQLDEEPVTTQANDLSKGAGYVASQVQTDPTTDTVEGRIQGLISKNSDLMKSAATRGSNAAQSRGLLNSSIAIGDAQRAVIDTAAPIATTDAGNSLAVKTGNVAAQNVAKNLGATGTQQLQQIGANTAGQSRLQTEKGLIESQQIAQQGDISKQLQDRKGQIDLELQTADSANQSRLLAEKGAIDLQIQTSNIQQQAQADKDLTAQKGAIDLQLQTADAASKAALLDKQGAIDMQLATLKGQQTMDLTTMQGNIDRQLQELRGDQAIALTGAQAEQEKGLIAARAQADAQLETLKAGLQTELQKLQGGQAQELARIDGDYKQLLQTNQSAAVMYSAAQAAIGEILANKDIKPDQKQALVTKQIEVLNNGLATVGAISGLDLGGLITAPAPTTSGAVTGPGTPGNNIRPQIPQLPGRIFG